MDEPLRRDPADALRGVCVRRGHAWALGQCARCGARQCQVCHRPAAYGLGGRCPFHDAATQVALARWR